MWTHKDPFVATAIQHPPVFLDLAASIAKACTLIEEAAADGASLIVFPETWLPGYPVWLDEAPNAALWGNPAAIAVWRRLFENSVSLSGGEVKQLQAAAKNANALVVMGMHERLKGTLYNTMLFLGADGEVVGVHRKLMPTYTERLVWGQGAGDTLTVYDTPLGRIGGLVCWEHWMPLTRYALHDQQELVHIAQWPTVKEMHLVASRHYAFEGQCFVVAAGTTLRMRDLAHLELVLLKEIPKQPDDFLQRGGSSIIAPDGTCLAGPTYDEVGLISAEINPALAIDGRLTLDVTGHYNRPDLFTLQIHP